MTSATRTLLAQGAPEDFLAHDRSKEFQDAMGGLRAAYIETIAEVALETGIEKLTQAVIQDGWTYEVWELLVGNRLRSLLTQRFGSHINGLVSGGYHTALLPKGATLGEVSRAITPFAENYAKAVAGQVEMTDSRAVHATLIDSLNKGLKKEAMIERVRRNFGLDPKSVIAMNNYEGKIRKDPGLLPKTAGRLIFAAVDRHRENRAKLIGRTTAMTAMNFGRLLMYEDAMARGILPRTSKKVWVTALDERVCSVCRPMDSVAVDWDAEFPVMQKTRGDIKIGILVPPAHPHCRCTIIPSTLIEQGIITRKARVGGVFTSDQVAKYWVKEHYRDKDGTKTKVRAHERRGRSGGGGKPTKAKGFKRDGQLSTAEKAAMSTALVLGVAAGIAGYKFKKIKALKDHAHAPVPWRSLYTGTEAYIELGHDAVHGYGEYPLRKYVTKGGFEHEGKLYRVGAFEHLLQNMENGTDGVGFRGVRWDEGMTKNLGSVNDLKIGMELDIPVSHYTPAKPRVEDSITAAIHWADGSGLVGERKTGYSTVVFRTKAKFGDAHVQTQMSWGLKDALGWESITHGRFRVTGVVHQRVPGSAKDYLLVDLEQIGIPSIDTSGLPEMSAEEVLDVLHETTGANPYHNYDFGKMISKVWVKAHWRGNEDGSREHVKAHERKGKKGTGFKRDGELSRSEQFAIAAAGIAAVSVVTGWQKRESMHAGIKSNSVRSARREWEKRAPKTWADVETQAPDFGLPLVDAMDDKPGFGLLDRKAYQHLEGSTREETLYHLVKNTKDRPIEYGFAIDKEGKIKAGFIGMEHNIRFVFPREAQGQGIYFFHNHPPVDFGPVGREVSHLSQADIHGLLVYHDVIDTSVVSDSNGFMYYAKWDGDGRGPSDELVRAVQEGSAKVNQTAFQPFSDQEQFQYNMLLQQGVEEADANVFLLDRRVLFETGKLWEELDKQDNGFHYAVVRLPENDIGKSHVIGSAVLDDASGVEKMVRVRSYLRADGTRVRSYLRRSRGEDHIRSLSRGTHVVPLKYLRDHRRPWGFRFGQDQHINGLAAKIKRDGFKQPIFVDVWEDKIHIWDGNHRLEAATRIGLKTVPVRVRHRKGKMPANPNKFLNRVEEFRLERFQDRIRNKPAMLPKDFEYEPSWKTNLYNRMNRYFIERGVRTARR